MIKDDVLVFDCVAHPFNFDPSNAIGQAGELFNNHLYAFHQVLTPEDEPKLSAEEFLKEWSTEEISRMVFEESDTDMLVAMPLPLTDLFHDGLSPWQRCVELAQENPDRTVFWGTVNPLEGRKALEAMEVQVKEYGAKAFKFYNVRYDYGESLVSSCNKSGRTSSACIESSGSDLLGSFFRRLIPSSICWRSNSSGSGR
jgi:hypothetical protein